MHYDPSPTAPELIPRNSPFVRAIHLSNISHGAVIVGYNYLCLQNQVYFKQGLCSYPSIKSPPFYEVKISGTIVQDVDLLTSLYLDSKTFVKKRN